MELKEKVMADLLEQYGQNVVTPHAKDTETTPKKRGRPPKVKVADEQKGGSDD